MLAVRVLSGPPPEELGQARVTHAWKDDRGDVYARARVGVDGYWLEWDGLGAFRFQPPDSRVSAWPAPNVARRHLVDAFERFLQPIVLQALGHPVLHASGALGTSGAVAFCGVSGSGKSTIARGLSRLGYVQFADDAVVLSFSGTDILVRPLPFAPRLRPSAIEALGAPPGANQAESGPADRVPLTSIILLSQDLDLDQSVWARRVPKHQAFQRVLTHAHSFAPEDPAEAARLARDYLELVGRVAVFDLAYRPDFSSFPEVLDAVVAITTGDRRPLARRLVDARRPARA